MNKEIQHNNLYKPDNTKYNMKKVIKTTGNSACIILDREDMKCYGLKVGEIINIEVRKDKK